MKKIPINDRIIIAVSRLVEDSQSRREPSHYDIKTIIERLNLSNADPHQQGNSVGKAKRIRFVLNWAVDYNVNAGEEFACQLITLIQGCGGFRENSPNYVGKDEIETLIDALKDENIILNRDGNLLPKILDNLTDKELTDALKSYINRAKKGSEDAALLVGTGKDLLESVAAYILQEKVGSYSVKDNFPYLIYHTFKALDLNTPSDLIATNAHPRKKIENIMFDLACSINTLRNKQGTGHGRPFLPDLTDFEAKFAIEAMGILAEYLLSKLESSRSKKQIT